MPVFRSPALNFLKNNYMFSSQAFNASHKGSLTRIYYSKLYSLDHFNFINVFFALKESNVLYYFDLTSPNMHSISSRTDCSKFTRSLVNVKISLVNIQNILIFLLEM